VREDTGELVGVGPELIIPQVTSKTEGKYICQAVDLTRPDRPHATSKAGVLVVRGSPRILSLEKGRLGARTVLECKAYSPGEGTIFEWLKLGEGKSFEKERGNELEGSLIHTSFLVLEEDERATDYSCRVTNDVGEDQRKVEVEESDFTIPVILGVSIPVFLFVLIVIFILMIRKQKSRESLERMEKGKIERKRCLSHRNISFVDD